MVIGRSYTCGYRYLDMLIFKEEVFAFYCLSKLFQEGDSTITARRDLLMEARVEVQKNLDKYQATMDRLNYKISRYEEAVKTGVLSWDAVNIKKD